MHVYGVNNINLNLLQVFLIGLSSKISHHLYFSIPQMPTCYETGLRGALTPPATLLGCAAVLTSIEKRRF